MKIYSKILSLALALVLAAGSAQFVFGFVPEVKAAESTAFSLSVEEEKGNTVTVEFSLVSGELNSLDMKFETSANIRACTKLVTSSIVKEVASDFEKTGNALIAYGNEVTKKLSMSSTASYDKKGAMIEATFLKTSEAPVNSNDIKATIITCSKADESHDAIVINTTVSSNLPAIAGSCGRKLYYVFDSASNELKIYGSGKMNDYAVARNTPWYSVADKIEKVTIDNGAESVGKNSMSGLTKITDISLPSTISSVGSYAFNGCTSLKSINFDNVSSIGAYAFKGCSSLNSIKFSDKISVLETGTFEGCKSIDKVEMLNNFKTINKDAFKDCSSELVISCYFGKTAYKYAVDNSIKYALLDKYIIGDVNGDNAISSQDALFILRCAVGELTPSDLQKFVGDINNDGVINSVDALIALEITVGKKDALSYQR